MQDGLARPLTLEIINNRGVKQKDIAVLAKDEVGSLPLGFYATPKEKSWFSVAETGQLYLFKDGTKHPISSFVAKQKGITPDFVVSQQVASAWIDGIALPPRDGTLIKGDSDTTVYLVKSGQLVSLSAAHFKARYNIKKIVTLPNPKLLPTPKPTR